MNLEGRAASAAWDPSTGKSVDDAELAALIVAAGASPLAAAIPEPPRADALHIDLVVSDGSTGQLLVADTFVTTDVRVASDRICTFLSRVVDGTSQVRIRIDALSAIVCLHPSGRAFQTVWMHCGLAHRAQTMPACIVYAPEQLPAWTQSVCSAFQDWGRNSEAVQRLATLARQREQAAQAGAQVPANWIH
jgi:hypothetical protein